MWVLAVICGAGAAWAVQAHIESKERDLQRRNQVPTVARVVAWADLPAGHVLQVEDLAQRDIPTAWASVQSLGPDDLEDVIGSRLRIAVPAGQPILRADLEDEQPATSARLAAGKRALTLPLRELAEAPPDMREGDHLDIYVSLTHDDKRLTLPLLQNSRVLAAPGLQGGQVVLEVSSADAVRIIAARQVGALTLALRAPEDMTAPALPAGELSDILGLQRQANGAIPVLYGDGHQNLPILMPEGP
ncbi:Flp pilus assembly protein CpaB [Bordetella holmesii CDC-H635-BH]|nr:Flp pilus assembly protein CpaB [Bordetella holmesii CDC-H809-BH]KAK80958.1 Flp pilus assembly protein CpaB [Bordetella holmesii CDC-H572-BH]KAK90092.1 Flp pilus assembly protein CpaB [Bordetella holmesii CDC-H635-BH]KCV03513.1 Flp pilus assembly protein CpaB [Bordetella holmesii CDC-H719-BH]KCV13012.1 Flp pilus assembly protein CpaB [Bordetella holmesii 04P3421]